MNTSYKNSSKFLSMYNELDKYLRKHFNEDNRPSHSLLVDEMAKESSVFRRYKQDLKSYANLRNAIVHDYKEVDSYPIAEPHIDIVEEYERLLNIVKNPPMALNTIAIAAKNVYITSLDAMALDVIKEMNKNTYTHVPVIKNNKMIGVFSENTILSYIAGSGDVIILNNTLINEFVQFIPFDKHESEYFEFVGRNTPVTDIEEIFQNGLKGKKRIAAVFITETGKDRDKLLGLVTAWDLAGYNDRYDI